jgi:propanediol utilization protein
VEAFEWPVGVTNIRIHFDGSLLEPNEDTEFTCYSSEQEVKAQDQPGNYICKAEVNTEN